MTDADRARRHVQGSDAQRVFDGIAHIARTRAGLPMMHAEAPVDVLDGLDDGILGITRRHPSGTLIGLFNVTDEYRQVPSDLGPRHGVDMPRELLSGNADLGGDAWWLPPYAAWWVVGA